MFATNGEQATITKSQIKINGVCENKLENYEQISLMVGRQGSENPLFSDLKLTPKGKNLVCKGKNAQANWNLKLTSKLKLNITIKTKGKGQLFQPCNLVENL